MELTIADCKRIIFWYHVAFQTQELSPEGEQETDLRFLPELQVDIQDFEKNHGKIARFLPELRDPSNGDKRTLVMIQNIARILSDGKAKRDEW
jgi:hypothetical protein|tara:strand:+ start:225 stop:503 length:279 start_codon:yes stop_codon:yes gene_type:complete